MVSKIISDIFVFFIDRYRFLELYTWWGKFIKCKLTKLKKAVAVERSKVPCTEKVWEYCVYLFPTSTLDNKILTDRLYLQLVDNFVRGCTLHWKRLKLFTGYIRSINYKYLFFKLTIELLREFDFFLMKENLIKRKWHFFRFSFF